MAQPPLTQTSPEGHTAPQVPQFKLLVSRLTQRPPQSTWPEGQLLVQAPPTQTWPEPQAFPQAPQFWGWVSGLTQPAPQIWRPTAQVPASGKSM